MADDRSPDRPAHVTGEPLDRILERWAAYHRLAPSQSAAIHDAVLATAGRASAAPSRSRRRQGAPRPGEVDAVAMGIATSLRGVSLGLRRILPGWPVPPADDLDTYRLYLRPA